MSVATTPRRSIGRIVLTVVFVALTLNALWEAFSGEDPTALRVLQSLVALSGAATAWGAWTGARWAPLAAVVYGVVVAAMLVSLEGILGLPHEARRGLVIGAAVVLVFALACAWWLRRERVSA